MLYSIQCNQISNTEGINGESMLTVLCKKPTMTCKVARNRFFTKTRKVRVTHFITVAKKHFLESPLIIIMAQQQQMGGENKLKTKIGCPSQMLSNNKPSENLHYSLKVYFVLQQINLEFRIKFQIIFQYIPLLFNSVEIS